MTEIREQQPTQKIYLTLLNGAGYLFNVDDYLYLRRKYRIVGVIVGISGDKGWAAADCTMPVELTPYETRLLMEQGLVELVSKTASLQRIPTEQEQTNYARELDLNIAAQEEELKSEKRRESLRNIDKILAGKRQKLNSEAEAKELHVDKVLDEICDSTCLQRENALLEIPLAHAYKHTAQLVAAPSVDLIKYQIFCDFWQRGKYITGGDTFGADFLIYPGDPMLFHASHIVIILNEPTIEWLQVIAKVRMSVVVNKYCVLAYVKPQESAEDKAKIHYQTVTWESGRDGKMEDVFR